MDMTAIIVAALGAIGVGGLGGTWLTRSKARAEAEAASSDSTRKWAEVFLVRIKDLEVAQLAMIHQHAAEKAELSARVDHLEEAQRSALQTLAQRDYRIHELEKENTELKAEISALNERVAAVEAKRSHTTRGA